MKTIDCLIELQLIEGNMAVPSAVRRKRIYELRVRSWYQLKEKKFLKPLIEDFYGVNVRSMEIGDLCEWGPFMSVQFTNGEEQNINIICSDAFGGNDIFTGSRERTGG